MANKPRRIEVKFPRHLSVPTLDSLKRHAKRCAKRPCKNCALFNIVVAHRIMKRATKRARDTGATPREVMTVFAEILLTST
jgi:hypothetical protein